MPRFFIEPLPPHASSLILDGENGKHISRSLRMKTGDTLTLCDGAGTDYHGSIRTFAGDLVTVDILSSAPSASEPKTQIHLFQSVPKSDKFEWIVQKATELGAVSVTAVHSSRCIAKLTDPDKKITRLQKIALEAAKQSGRGMVPSILPPLSFKQAIAEATTRGDVLFFYEKSGERLADVIAESGSVLSVFVGPEGGYSPEEADFALAQGAKLCTLGPRILRAETAPLAALSILLFAKGEMDHPLADGE